MTADLLTRAATKARDLANTATPGPWRAGTTGVRNGDHWYVVADGEALAQIASNDGDNEELRGPTAQHITAWDPEAARAAADLLGSLANAWRLGGAPPAGAIAACQLARHLLGEDS